MRRPTRLLQWIRRITITVAGVGLAALYQGCTIYQGCAEIYRDERVLGASLTEACSRGVTFQSKSEDLAEMHCRSNYFHDSVIAACIHGIRMYERGTEGPVIRGGLDR